jgi:hypothetical protein
MNNFFPSGGQGEPQRAPEKAYVKTEKVGQPIQPVVERKGAAPQE